MILRKSAEYMAASSGVSDQVINLMLALALVAVVLVLPDFAAAATTSDNSVSKVVCNVVLQLKGPVARGIAAFGIIFLGFSLFLGKISWGTALALGIGLGAIFGAEEIVGLISGDDAAKDCVESKVY